MAYFKAKVGPEAYTPTKGMGGFICLCCKSEIKPKELRYNSSHRSIKLCAPCWQEYSIKWAVLKVGEGLSLRSLERHCNDY